MGLILQNLSGFTWGAPNAEVGCNIDRMTFAPTAKMVEVPDNQGQDRGFVSYNPTQEVTLEGETVGTNGVMAATIGTAIVFANQANILGISNTGNTYTMGGTLELSREALQKITIRAKRFNAF
jgi:hypothetical protein